MGTPNIENFNIPLVVTQAAPLCHPQFCGSYHCNLRGALRNSVIQEADLPQSPLSIVDKDANRLAAEG
jgi:hypothetical protein